MRKRILKYIIFLVLIPCFSGITTTAMPFESQRYEHFGNPFASHSNIWGVLSRGLTIDRDYTDNHYVREQVKWYCKQKYYIHDLTRNAQPYIYYVLEQTRKRGMPAEVALLPMIESDYDPFVYSNRGATGLWQLMPGTASGFGLVINWWYDGRRDVVASTNAALNELQYLHDYFHNWLLAFAAYDAGQGAVVNAIRYNRRHGRPTDFWALPLPRETKIYVPKLLALAEIIQHHQHYGVQLEPVKNKPYFTTVKLKKQMNLNKVALLSDSSAKLIRHLNPGFRRSDTMPHHKYNLLVPISQVDTFREKLVMAADPLHYSNAFSNKWAYHHIKPGDSLRMLASRYDTTTAELQKINQLKGNNALEIGENILIPQAEAGTLSHQPKKISEDGLPGPKRIYYVLKPHETLTDVARRFHVTADDIWFWNEFNNNTKIHAHMKLTLWVSSHSRRHPRHKERHYAYHYRRRDFYYRVRPGDSVDRIAHQFHIRGTTLRNANHLHTEILQVGQRLWIP